MRFCPLCSGSSGNSTYLEAGNVRLLVDAGLSCKRITELLRSVGGDPASLTAILITHDHSDHIKGVNILSKKYDLPVYANTEVWSRMQNVLPDVAPKNVCVFENDRPFFIGEVGVLPFRVHHDAAGTVGYVFTHRDHRAAICTDTGHIDKRMLDALSGSDLVLLEANHDVDMLMAGGYPYPLKRRILSGTGHLCNEDCASALVELYHRGVKSAILGHLSAENNAPDIALITVHAALDAAGIGDRMQIALALRDRPTGIFELA
ncbi:MAG: MBL fold metallo-hydrolase [Clostridia bacterium]|nr:MBL fold metallo-hydrolase [Clostridia bacterium]